jgi:transposase
MTELNLSSKERAALTHLIAHTSDARILQRAYALLWLADGKTYPTIADQLSVSRQTVYNWVERFRQRTGSDLEKRLADAQRSGRPCTAQGVIDPLIDAIIDTSPRELNYPSTIWTASLLVCYLADQHQLTVSCQSVRLAIGRLKIRWKRPRHYLALRSSTWRQAKGA